MSEQALYSVTSLRDFDPRRVPVSHVDAELSALKLEWLTPDNLRRHFLHPPPWQPEIAAERRFTDRPITHASVLIPIVAGGGVGAVPTVLLTQRTTQMSNHSGQVAFPGGKADAHDANAVSTALREAHEEIGLTGQFVEVIGTLPTYLTGSAFVVTPVVALIRPGFSLVPNPHEVAEIFQVPLPFLMNPTHHRHHAVEHLGSRREWLSMPYVHPETGKEHFIWGATAAMLRNLYRFLSNRGSNSDQYAP